MHAILLLLLAAVLGSVAYSEEEGDEYASGSAGSSEIWPPHDQVGKEHSSQCERCLQECHACKKPKASNKTVERDCPLVGWDCESGYSRAFAASTGPDCMRLHCSDKRATLFVKRLNYPELICAGKEWHYFAPKYELTTKHAVCGRKCDKDACSTRLPMLLGVVRDVSCNSRAKVRDASTAHRCAVAYCRRGERLFGGNVGSGADALTIIRVSGGDGGGSGRFENRAILECTGDGFWRDPGTRVTFDYPACRKDCASCATSASLARISLFSDRCAMWARTYEKSDTDAPDGPLRCYAPTLNIVKDGASCASLNATCPDDAVGRYVTFAGTNRGMHIWSDQLEGGSSDGGSVFEFGCEDGDFTLRRSNETLGALSSIACILQASSS